MYGLPVKPHSSRRVDRSAQVRNHILEQLQYEKLSAVVCCRYVASGPLVRSSYRAGEFFIEAMIKDDAAATRAV